VEPPPTATQPSAGTDRHTASLLGHLDGYVHDRLRMDGDGQLPGRRGDLAGHADLP
jgi:hypothetical protein